MAIAPPTSRVSKCIPNRLPGFSHVFPSGCRSSCPFRKSRRPNKALRRLGWRSHCVSWEMGWNQSFEPLKKMENVWTCENRHFANKMVVYFFLIFFGHEYRFETTNIWHITGEIHDITGRNCWASAWKNFDVPSGKRLHSYWKWPSRNSGFTH